MKDIIILGRHARIMNKLSYLKLYDNFASMYENACLIGLLHGKKSKQIKGKNVQKEEDVVQVTRTYFQKRLEHERILLTMLQQEKVFEGEPLLVNQVFNAISLEDKEVSRLHDELKEYSLYGLEVMEKEYADIWDIVDQDSIIEFQNEKNLKSVSEIDAFMQQFSSEKNKKIDFEVAELLSDFN